MPRAPASRAALRALAAVALGVGCRAAASGTPAPSPEVPLVAYRDSIPGTLVTFDMVPVPGGTVTIAGRAVTVKPFWIGRTELTWDAYDPFAFGPGSGGARGSADAESRPSRPYGAPDYGFGHAGFPAISVARSAADAYCRWLSEKTGKRYRLPTEAEWVRAAELAAGGAGGLGAGRRDELAWHAGNAGGKSHAVGTRRPDALGLSDLFGNAAEWVASDDGRPVTRGGSWRDPADSVGPRARAAQDESWNERDPQIPKSPWWLSDGPFVGFRVVREP
ncbi:MAG TPA: SUMF1/EgtB/PvdO family nonheme iron enzyme [Gemmatimonadaceae bacterium]|nr:SUMF1/EgtB/PvdO family nonheme iron enzyme [Gemmatimonadaceae bacterium]